MKRILDHGDVIEIISGGPDEWAKSHAIRDAFIAQWEAAAKSGETSNVQLDGAQNQTISAKVGGKDENRIFDAITAHYKALAQGASPETAPPLPEMNRIRREGDVIIMRVGGPDEWAASNAIVAEARARWEAEAAAKNGEFRAARNRKPNRLASRAPKSPIRPRTLCRY